MQNITVCYEIQPLFAIIGIYQLYIFDNQLLLQMNYDFILLFTTFANIGIFCK